MSDAPERDGLERRRTTRWKVTLEAAGPDRNEIGAELAALGEVLSPFNGEVAGRHGSYSATLSFEEPDLDVVSALSLAHEIFRDHTFDVGLPDWPVVRAVVITSDDH